MSGEINYITDSEGHRIAVIVPIEEIRRILADMGATLDDYEKNPSAFLVPVLDQLNAAGKIELGSHHAHRIS